MLVNEALNFLAGKIFVNIATSSLSGRPNVAPKLLLKVRGNSIYLVDYVRNTTLKNIKANPQVSISSVNLKNLKGYQINGTAVILKSAKSGNYQKLLAEYDKKSVDLSVKRLIAALHSQTKSANFEAEFPKKVSIIKVRVREAVGIGLQGNLEREKYG